MVLAAPAPFTWVHVAQKAQPFESARTNFILVLDNAGPLVGYIYMTVM